MSSLDKENTLRILKGQHTIQSLRCRLGFHRWTAWEYQPPTDDRRTFNYSPEFVRCNCADCGLVRIEKPYSKTISNKAS